MLICKRCEKEKEENLFYTDKRTKNGYSYYCKACEQNRQQQYVAKNRQEINRRARLKDEQNRQAQRDKTNNWRKKYKKKCPEYFLWASAKQRAKHQKLPFTIEVKDIIIPKTCPVLGIQISTETTKGFIDNAASIDKIIPILGYVPGNIIVVSYRANKIKTNATFEELRKVADFYCNL